jgi:hypothetical protein
MTPLNILSFGASPTRDSTAEIAKALAVGKAQRQPVLIPPGTWQYSDVLNVDGIELYGEDGAILHAVNTDRCAIFLRGVEVGVRGLRLTGVKPAKRTAPYEMTRVVAFGAIDFWVRDMLIDSGSGAGVMTTREAKNGQIERNRISGTLADSIHITNRSSFISVMSNEIENSGDDGIAVVSYRAQVSPCHHIIAKHNKIRNNVWGRCMSVVGGEDVLYEHNEMSGNATAAGFYFAQEKAYDTLPVKNVTANRNTIINCGNVAKGHYAVMIFSNEHRNENVTLSRNLIVQDGLRGGVRAFGDQVGVAVDSNVISNAKTDLVVAEGVVVTPYSGGPVGAM